MNSKDSCICWVKNPSFSDVFSITDAVCGGDGVGVLFFRSSIWLEFLTLNTSILNVNKAPKLIIDFTSIDPPRDSQIYLQMLRPKAWPLTFALRLCSSFVLKKGVNTCSSSDAWIPRPLSCTETSSCLLWLIRELGLSTIWAEITMFSPFVYENLTAFFAKLRRTYCKRYLSNSMVKLWIFSNWNSKSINLAWQSALITSRISRMVCSGDPNSRLATNLPCSTMLWSIKSFE